MRVVAIAGGTGSAKLLKGLTAVLGSFTVVANVGDNMWVHGLYVCPDIDIAIYTLAGMADSGKGWGVAHDTFHALAQMSRLGETTWFKLGDRDLAMHVVRTELIRRGLSLSQVTERARRALGVAHRILPATDADVETRIVTRHGEIHLQDFWVKGRGRAAVLGVKYPGAGRAPPTSGVRDAITRADKIIICPANPITSVMPILSLKGMRALIASSRAEKLAVSPMIGSRPYSGPARKLMRATGHGTDSVAVAALYSRLIDKLIIDSSDVRMREKIEELGVACLPTKTLMRTDGQERMLAKFLMES